MYTKTHTQTRSVSHVQLIGGLAGMKSVLVGGESPASCILSANPCQPLGQ